MEWVLLEVVTALVLVAAIVWWTFPRGKDEARRHAAARDSATDEDSGGDVR